MWRKNFQAPQVAKTMGKRSRNARGACFFLLLCCCFHAGAASLQLATQRGPSFAAPAGGDGDSAAPIISANGRFVLFASSADNLLLNNASNAITGLFPPKLNVFLRDRTNGTTSLVSIDVSGTTGGNGDSVPVEISTDGRYALFESAASNLVSGDTNNTGDIFVRDLLAGATLLVSVSTVGGFGNGASRGSVMTPDGRYVAFVSAASNLVSSDTNGIPDIFVRDLQNNVTVLASPGAKATGAPSGSESPLITPSGRFVVFYSSATNLVPGVATASEVYVRDLMGATTFLASTNARTLASSVAGTANLAFYNHSISDDGQYVAFQASSAVSNSKAVVFRCNLASGVTDVVSTNGISVMGFENARSLDLTPDGRFIVFLANAAGGTGPNGCVYIWDGQTSNTALVSADLNNAAPTNFLCAWPVVDLIGRYVAFFSTAPNLTSNALAGGYNLFVRDVQSGTTLLVNQNPAGIGSILNPVTCPSLSSNGLLVAFECQDSTLVTNDNNHQYDAFVRDLSVGTNDLVSVRHASLPAMAANGASTVSLFGLSTNGQFVAFSSRADNLTTNDSNGLRDVFLRDLLAGTTTLVSANTNGISGTNGISVDASVSGNGRYVAFASAASDLVAGDANNAMDVFVRDIQTGSTALVSVNTNGTGSGNRASTSPVISGDGRFVLFHSLASNLAPGVSSAVDNIYFRDMQAGVTKVLTTNTTSALAAAMTADGRYIAYAASSSLLYVYDTQLAKRVYTNTLAGTTPTTVGISPNGARIAMGFSGQVTVADLVAHTNGVISGLLNTSRPGLRFSADGRFLVYATASALAASDTNQTSDVYLYDFQTQTHALISRSFASGAAARGPSDSPDISSDGRFIAYRSQASDIVPGDTNGLPDIFLFDRVLNTTTLVTASSTGSSPGNGRSLLPVLSADAHTLAFESWAGNLAPLDLNQAGDLFVANLAPAVISDTDGDGMDDAWEMQHFGTLARDGTGDFDGDGVSDLYEFQTGTDPTDPGSFFRVEITGPGTVGGGAAISWAAAPGRSYRLQFKNTLTDPVWQDLNGNVVLIGNKGYASDLTPNPTQRFYRLVVGN